MRALLTAIIMLLAPAPALLRAALDASGLASPTGHAPLLSDELWTPDGSIPTPANEVVFEAADPEVFAWYVKSYGPEVNLFVDHSQILQLEGLRQNIWGNKSTWGRVLNPA